MPKKKPLQPEETLQTQGVSGPEANKETDWENVAKRALADLDNYKKQQDKLRGEMTQFMNMALLVRFLEVQDDLSRVLHTVHSKKLDPTTIPKDVMECQMGVMEGVGNILKKFDEIFKSEGLDKIEVKPGDKFDPKVMEAMSHEEHKEYKEDAVIEQLQAGLKYKEQIIKPAKVRVGK
ncbi:nucleotide exchange factor GrpE [Patescibacteria group bacterium]|nr:nucleotide exchange factor GrpE [Patescibacteria group bacterium]